MVQSFLPDPALIGRKAELEKLQRGLDEARGGRGSTFLVSGEAGIGKSRLVEEFVKAAGEKGFKVLTGGAAADTVHPFLMISNMLEGEIETPLFLEQEHASFSEIFAVNRAGLLVAQASPEEGGIDADIFAGMLSAVQNFVSDSIDASRERKAGLGRLEYGNLKILIENGDNVFLTAVFSESEHPDMLTLLKKTVSEIEDGYGNVLKGWTGIEEEVAPIQTLVTKLADARFLVRRNLEGVKLENERIRMADRVLEILLDKVKGQPLLLLLEDLHWADESSLFVLSYLARNLTDARVMIVGTARPSDRDMVVGTLEQMRAEGIVSEIELDFLGKTDVQELIDEMYAPNDFPDDLLGQVFDRSEGNPFFLIELLRQMQAEGGIVWSGERFSMAASDYVIPSSVEDVVFRRMDKLEPGCVALAEYASCLGREFEMSAAMSFGYAPESEKAMDVLRSSGIIFSDGESARFSHAIFQDVIYGGVSDRWRPIYHKSLGEHFETVYADRKEEVLYDLAKHFGRSREYAKALDYNVRAGEMAANTFAPEQAIDFFNIATEVIPRVRGRERIIEMEVSVRERLGDLHALTGHAESALSNYSGAFTAAEDKHIKARMLRKTGAVQESTGDFDRSLESLAEAKVLIADTNDPEYGRICLGEGYAHYRKTDYDKAMARFGEAQKVFETHGDEGPDLGNSYRAMGNVHYALGELDRSLEYYGRSLEVMERNVDNQGMGQVLNNIGLIYRIKGELDNAIVHLLRSLEMLEKVGDKKSTAALLNNIGNVYTSRGELKTSIQYHMKSLEIKKTIGNVHGEAMSLNNIGNIYQQISEPEKALECHRRALEIRERIGDKQGAAASLNNLGNTYFALGDMDKAQEYNARSLKIKEEIGDKLGIALSYINMGHAYLMERDLDNAEASAVEGMVRCRELGDKEQMIPAHQILCELNLLKGNNERAMELGKEALAMAVEIGAKSDEGLSRVYLGMVNRDIGELEKAKDEFEKAGAILESNDDKQKYVRYLYERAILSKKTGDVDGARQELEKVMAMCSEMRMGLWEKRSREMLEGL